MRQLTIYDILPAKTILIKYQEQNGIRHAEKITTTDIKACVINWRRRHTEYYFIGIEET